MNIPKKEMGCRYSEPCQLSPLKPVQLPASNNSETILQFMRSITTIDKNGKPLSTLVIDVPTGKPQRFTKFDPVTSEVISREIYDNCPPVIPITPVSPMLTFRLDQTV